MTDTSDREIKTVRVFDAPRELVFKVWTQPEHIRHWWGPNGFTNTIDEMDVRPGGTWRLTMHGPDGTNFPNVIVYQEVVKPERLVYSHGDDKGPLFMVTVTFEDEGGKTRLTMRAVFPTVAARDKVIREVGAVEGAKQTLGRLAEYLEKIGEAGEERQ